MDVVPAMADETLSAFLEEAEEEDQDDDEQYEEYPEPDEDDDLYRWRGWRRDSGARWPW